MSTNQDSLDAARLAVAEVLATDRPAHSRGRDAEVADGLHPRGTSIAMLLGELLENNHPRQRPLPSPRPGAPVPNESWEFHPPYSDADPDPATEQYEPLPTPSAPYVACESWSSPPWGMLSAAAYVSGMEAGGTAGNAPHFQGVGEKTDGPLVRVRAGASLVQRKTLTKPIEARTYAGFYVFTRRQSSGHESFLDAGAPVIGTPGVASVNADLTVYAAGINTTEGGEDFDLATSSVNLLSGTASAGGISMTETDANVAIYGGLTLSPGRDQMIVIVTLSVEASCTNGSSAVASIDMAQPFAPTVYGIQRGQWGNELLIPSIGMQLWG